LSRASVEGPADTPRFEDLLATLEKTIAELAGGTAPLEELVTAHQRAVRILAEAQSRLDELKSRADLIAQSLRDGVSA
jgi:exodeoxyribonuclease VII small subunit